MVRVRAKLQQSGLATVKVCLLDYLGRVWNGSAFVAFSTLADTAAWQAGLLTASEELLADSTATGVYEVDAPAGVAVPFTALFYAQASPVPGDVISGYQEVTDLELISTGNVVADGANSATSFKTDLTGLEEDYVGRLIVLCSGTGALRPTRISAFNEVTLFVTVATELPGTPTSGAGFSVLGMIEA